MWTSSIREEKRNVMTCSHEMAFHVSVSQARDRMLTRERLLGLQDQHTGFGARW
ncbi:hypothetical protein LEMLEM_LOCUS10329, partial [Lemmus lemmus]